MMIVALAVFFAFPVALNDVRHTAATWRAFEKGVTAKLGLVADLRSALGYGGVIHQFKDFILRKDRLLIVAIQAKMLDVSVALTAYASRGMNEAEKRAITEIAATLDQYLLAVAVAEKMAAEGIASQEIDEAVRIDDTAALTALAVLDTELLAARGTSAETVYQSVSKVAVNLTVAAVTIGGLVILLVVGFFWFTRMRLVKPLMALGDAMKDLAQAKGDIDIPLLDDEDELGDMARTVAVFKENMVLRQRAERELRKSQRDLERRVEERTEELSGIKGRLEMILDNATSGIITIGEDGIIQSFNRAAESIFGYTSEETIGRNVKMLMPDSFAAGHDGYIASYLGTGEAKVIGLGREVEGLRKDGGVFPMDLGISEQISGGKRLFTGLVTDISERKEAEAALRESEKGLAEAQQIAHIGNWERNLETSIISWSDETYRIFGIEPQAIEVDFDMFLKFIHPEDRQTVRETKKEAEREKRSYAIDFRIVRPDGSVRTLQTLGEWRPKPTGEAFCVGGTIQDITDRKRVEEALRENESRLRAITDNLTGGVYRRVLHPDGTISYPYLSEEFRRMFGVDPEKTMTDPECIFGRLHGDDIEDALKKVEKSAESLEPYDCEFRLIGDDGTMKWCHSTAKPRLEENGDVVWDGLVIDITDRKRAEDALVAARDEADRANRAKSEFLSSMSHELRTPMNAILGFAQLLENNPKKPLDRTQKESVQQILKGGDHLLTLIDDVLDLARIESGQFALDMEPTDPAVIIGECLDMTRTLAAKRGIEVIDGTRGVALPAAMIDATRFRQVLLNLLSNAVKYNHEGGSVALKAHETPEGRLRVTVTDTGPGIPMEKQEQLFQPFSRLGLEATDIQGTGIGLTITKRIVEMMDGRIGFESALGKGSTFWVEVPTTGDRVAPETQTGTVQVSADPVTPGGHTVLYVEDNPANLKLMETLILRLEGITMLSAHTGELGVMLAEAHKPDVILMDINLPGIDGIEALKRLKDCDATRDIPVIALTARAMPQDIERGLEVGFHSYLTKPIRIAEVTAALESALPVA